MLIDPFHGRNLSRCFYLDIVLDNDCDLDKKIRDTLMIEEFIQKSMDGSIPLFELIEGIEPYLTTEELDSYVDTVEDKLEHTLEWYLYNYKNA